MESILVISKENKDANKIKNCFKNELKVDQVINRNAALNLLTKKRYDLLYIDLEILRPDNSGNDYKSSLKPFWSLYPTIEIVIMTSQDRIREAVGFVKAGASNYVTYPLNPEELKFVSESINDNVMVLSELDYLRGQFWEKNSQGIVHTKNRTMKNVYEKVRSVAPTKSTVLLNGETGTGKGVMASLIHQHSNRKEDQFISVHCGAIPDTLLESELFGHEKGAFTGAVKRKLGKFEIASGGTIFLDEIGTMTPSAQIKLLQVLQDGTYQRVGGEGTLEADVRIIAATNEDLQKMCDEGRFRKDLYYRLNVFPIEVPPLRERVEDIPHFIESFLIKMNRINTKDVNGVDSVIIGSLKSYPWPGNIRELENIIERAYILENSSILTLASFPEELIIADHSMAKILVNSASTLSDARQKAIEAFERIYIHDLLYRNRGKINLSAEEAGISTRQLHKLMTKYHIRKDTFK
ncbi:sigma-54-dependent transcriptional regulator [Thermodesulfobacteriota bacterium]